MAPDSRILGRVDVNVWDQDQMRPDLAFGGERYLVSWGDRRASVEQIYYTQVTREGLVLDPAGKRLPGQDSAGFQGLPALASNGENYFLGWMGTAWIGTVIYGTRLGLDGAVLDSVPIRFTPDTLFHNSLAVETDGEDYLVVWDGETPGAIGDDICCARVSSSGVVLDSAPGLLARVRDGANDPAVAFLGDRYLVVWTDMTGRDVYGCRVMRDGTVLDYGGFPIGAGPGIQREPDVAADGSRFLVVWSGAASEDFDIYGEFVDTSGVVGLATGLEPRTGGARLVALPNPARSSVWLGDVGRRGVVGRSAGSALARPELVKVFDAQGRIVRSLTPVSGRARWDCLDERRSLVPAGVYFARSTAGFTCRFVIAE